MVEGRKLYTFLESLKDSQLPAEFVPEYKAASTDPNSEESEISVPATDDEQKVAIDILHEDEEDLEVEMGDMVTYCAANSSTADAITVRITQTHNNFDQGLVSLHTPLGQVLLGATVGETVVLRVPGHPARQFNIKGIRRPRA